MRGTSAAPVSSTRLNHYRLLGCTLATDFSLPGLVTTPSRLPAADGEALIVVDREVEGGASDIDWRHDWKAPDGQVLLRLGRTADRHVLRFPGQADFEIRTSSLRIGVRSAAACTPTVGHLLVNQVLPRVLAHRGGLLLHASAVELHSGAVAFLGPTGAGKSTLAAAFSARSRRVVTDDALAVCWSGGLPHVFGCRAPVRLRPDSSGALGYPGPASGKRPVTPPFASDEGSESVPLAAVVALDARPRSGRQAAPPSPRRRDAEEGPDHAPVRLTMLSPGRALLEVMTHSFQLDPLDRQLARLRLPVVADLVQRVPVLALEYRHDWCALDDVCDLLAGRLLLLSAERA